MGNSTLERHLFSRHSIIIPKVRSNQTVLNFKCTTSWPIKEKSERDYSVVIWIIDNQQPFSVIENKKFIKMMNIFNFHYKVPDRHQIKEISILEFNKRHSNIKYDLNTIPIKISFLAKL